MGVPAPVGEVSDMLTYAEFESFLQFCLSLYVSNFAAVIGLAVVLSMLFLFVACWFFWHWPQGRRCKLIRRK